MNVFQRRYKLDDLKAKSFSDYTPGELVSYVTTVFPGDPIGALKSMRDTYEIGSILYGKTLTMLEVVVDATRKSTCNSIS